MRFAIAVSGIKVSGPGEAGEILVYDMDESSKLLESYENPALTVMTARGIAMIKSVIDKGVEKLVISGIGDHAFEYAAGRIELLNGHGMSRDEVLAKILKGELEQVKVASHRVGHHHTHS